MSKMTERTFSPCSGNLSPSDGDKRTASLSPSDDPTLANLVERKLTRDGNQPKRRGPKPDSKPALTRRQELNRQAQRTHRERKELYVKALEDEVLRLKDIFSHAAQAKAQLAEENRQLRETLQQHGIPLPAPSTSEDLTSDSFNPSGSAPSYGSGSQAAYTPVSAPSLSLPLGNEMQSTGSMTSYNTPTTALSSRNSGGGGGGGGVDTEQAGIDFVLSLERPCMSHLPRVLDRLASLDDVPCGHALMACCPPRPFSQMDSSVLFGPSHIHGDNDMGQQTWEVDRSSLHTLLDLSDRLDLDGEVTPVMAWRIIMSHPRFNDMRPVAFQRLAEELGGKIRCYGFGAVLEDFEVRDALENVAGPYLCGMI